MPDEAPVPELKELKLGAANLDDEHIVLGREVSFAGLFVLICLVAMIFLNALYGTKKKPEEPKA